MSYRFVVTLIVCLQFMPTLHAEEPVKHIILVSVDGLSGSYLNDPRAELPNLRALAAKGASAEGMQTSFPSVTWPSHTSLITGSHPAKHGVIGNSVWNRETGKPVVYIGDPVLTKQQAIRTPTLYDIAHAAGLSTASVIWPCSNGADTLNWVIPDSNKQELHDRYTTPGFAEELKSAGIDISPLGGWGWGKQHSTNRDLLYTQVTKYLLEKHRVNLILVHLITPDGVEHAYGPNTPPAYAAVAESDQRIGEIWAALQQPPFAGNSTLFVVSDHGFAPYEKLIRPNVVLKDLGLIETDDKDKVTHRSAWCVAQGGSAFIYLFDESKREEHSKMLVQKFGQTKGVQAVIEPKGFAELGIPDPKKNPEAPHLVLTTGPGYSFANNTSGPVVIDAGGLKGSHGHDPRPDYMHAMFIAAGKGIRPATKLDIIQNVDVAPTIAHLLGLKMDADGKVLKEILSE
ncbi:alkaline phosphatase family protein [Thalassoglobus sp.]|uniref:alkaline phosphatase family protein n=1 Tax=Thalassoglobus sp. TaxID=2795869 RepID=UPI003AA9D159